MSNSSFWNNMVISFLHLDRECLGSFEFLRIGGNVSLTKPDCLHQALHWHTSTGWLSCDLPQQSLAWCSLPNWFYLYLTSSIDNSGSSKDVKGVNQDRSNREHRVMKNNVCETEMQKNNRERNIILKLQQESTTESHFFPEYWREGADITGNNPAPPDNMNKNAICTMCAFHRWQHVERSES